MTQLSFRRVNSNFTPRFEVDMLIPVSIRYEKQIEGGILYYQVMESEDKKRFISFGLDGYDQWWSSRCEVIDHYFGIKTADCYIRMRNTKQPELWYAGYGVFRDQIQLPNTLEWKNCGGQMFILPKKGITFPKGNDYFSSTELDAQGNVTYPKINKSK